MATTDRYSGSERARRLRERLRSGLFGASSSVGWCAACGLVIGAGEDPVRVHGNAYHADCALYRPRSKRNGDER